MSGLEVLFVVTAVLGITVLFVSLVFGEIFDLIGDIDVDGPSWMSSSMLSAAIAAFGISGFVAISSGARGIWAILVAIVVGAAIGFIVVNFIQKPLARQQGNSHISRESYVGQNASVTLRIPPGGWGEVRFRDTNGAQVSERAYSATPTEVPAGARVVIDTTSADGVVVSEIN